MSHGHLDGQLDNKSLSQSPQYTSHISPNISFGNGNVHNNIEQNVNYV